MLSISYTRPRYCFAPWRSGVSLLDPTTVQPSPSLFAARVARRHSIGLHIVPPREVGHSRGAGGLEVAVEGSRSECPRPSVPSDSADQQHFDSVETDEFARRRMLPIQTSSFSRLPHWSRHDADSPAVAKASWALRLWFSCTALAGISVPEPGHDRPAIHTASYPPAKLACILAHLTHKTRLRRVRLMVASMVS